MGWVEGRGYISPELTAGECELTDGDHVTFSTMPGDEKQKAPYVQNEIEEETEAKKPKREPKNMFRPSQGPHIMKKPTPPFMSFTNEHRAEIRARSDVKTYAEVPKKGVELYNALPEEEKAERQKKYDEEMQVYRAWASSEEGMAA